VTVRSRPAIVMLAIVMLAIIGAGCENKTEKLDINEIKDEVGVDFARKNLAEIDAKLASTDPGAASSICAVIKPDLPAIQKADKKLAADVEKRCGRDLAVRSFAVYVEAIEAEHSRDPGKRSWECSSLDIYWKPVITAKADADPEALALKARHGKTCPPK
jgi:hypothetical protein